MENRCTFWKTGIHFPGKRKRHQEMTINISKASSAISIAISYGVQGHSKKLNLECSILGNALENYILLVY